MATDPALRIDIAVEADAWRSALDQLETLTEQALNAALRDCPAPDAGIEVSLLLTDDGHIQTLNRDFRAKDTPTNVLSFPAQDPEDLGTFMEGGLTTWPEGMPLVLGDIALAYGVVSREAEELGKPLQDHFCHMLVHGMLHLLGYDHEEAEDADEMEALEIQVLATLDVPNPYHDAPVP